jgi:hypothetical protein
MLESVTPLSASVEPALVVVLVAAVVDVDPVGVPGVGAAVPVVEVDVAPVVPVVAVVPVVPVVAVVAGDPVVEVVVGFATAGFATGLGSE